MTSSPRLSIIVARARNGVIGRDGDIPWRLRDDLAFFKRATQGKPVIMGRNTWESLPRRPLPGRACIVLTRDWTYAAEGARVYSSFAAAVAAAKAMAQRTGEDEVFIAGGEAIYALGLSAADRLYLTEVDVEVDGDTYFPSFDEAAWRETSAEPHAADERNDHAFTLRILDKVR